MKSSLVILYHREPHDEIIKDGKIHYVPKKSPNGIVPTLKSFFADVNQGTWIAWKQVGESQRKDFEELWENKTKHVEVHDFLWAEENSLLKFSSEWAYNV